MEDCITFKNFKLHIYKGYVQNNFLVEYRDKILLIDGACKPDADNIASFIQNRLKRDISDLKLTAVTHCHPDHAGAASILSKKYHVPSAAPYDMDLWYSGIGGALQHISDTMQSQFMAKQSKPHSRTESLFYPRLLNSEYKLTDGSTLPFFNDWKAIHAPGHTWHNLMLYNEQNGLLYIADTVIDGRNKFLPPVPVLFPSAMKESLMKIKQIKPESLLFAHSDAAILPFKESIVDQVIKKIDSKDSYFIRFFYILSKFTGEYRKHREKTLS